MTERIVAERREVAAEKTATRPVRGTYEWAVATVNCSVGCPHDCRYCYARQNFMASRGENSADKWVQVSPIAEDQDGAGRQYAGVVMFPSQHDIVPENLDECLRTLKNLLSLDNQVLIVSKPHRSCIDTICRELISFRSRIVFRFTITARREEILRLWEPGAPGYPERLACLELAKGLDFKTSVSVEPILDMDDVVSMVNELLPLVTDTIWLGKMNKIAERVFVDTGAIAEAAARIIEKQNDDRIRDLYRKLSVIQQIRWKESIKTVIGLPQAPEPGLDM